MIEHQGPCSKQSQPHNQWQTESICCCSASRLMAPYGSHGRSAHSRLAIRVGVGGQHEKSRRVPESLGWSSPAFRQVSQHAEGTPSGFPWQSGHIKVAMVFQLPQPRSKEDPGDGFGWMPDRCLLFRSSA